MATFAYVLAPPAEPTTTPPGSTGGEVTFRDSFYSLVPGWLSTGEGELVLYSLHRMLDTFAERALQSLLCRYPTHAPADALPYLGRDRKIVRGIDEPADAYAARLLRYLDDHRTRGNPFALQTQLRAYLQADVRIRTVDRRGNWYTTDYDGTRSVSLNRANWDWDGTSVAQWARFWVIIYPVDGTDPWEIPADWATVWPTGTISATPAQVSSVRSIIREWKPAGTTCEWVIVAFDDTKFDPTDADLGGTWGRWGYDSGGGVYLPVRETSARYWLGRIT